MEGKGQPIVWSSLVAGSAVLAALALDPTMPGIEPGSALAAILDALRIPADLAGITVSNDAHHPNRIVQYVVQFLTYAAIFGAIYWSSIQLFARMRDRESRLHYRQRFILAVMLSVIAHVLVLGFTPKKPSSMAPGPIANVPLNVVIVPTQEPPAAAPSEPPKVAAVTPPTAAQRPAPRKRPEPAPAPVTPIPAPVAPLPTPVPVPPPIPAPPVDMLAAIEARRAQRRAADAASARGPPTKPTEDAATRNLATLSGREGVGGVFQVLRIGTRTGEFAFNGWKPDSRSQWREVIEVDAGLHGNVELAMIRRMIVLIRTHYTGDFYWESHRLQRVVTLSARPEDNEGLEDFMMREFFGQPVVNPRR